MESLAWSFMHWFYSQLDVVYVNSEHYRQRWIERGIAPEKLKILPRGIDTTVFTPAKRDPGFWEQYGKKPEELGLLYVGRISKEKNIDVAVEAFRKLYGEGLPVRLLIVGDGPYLRELRQTVPEACFTGYLTAELATAYASSDIFVFPSTTDTFGNVVLEAKAAGLPCIVSNRGGPCELVEDGADGFITRALDVGDFARVLRLLCEDSDLRTKMGREAKNRVQDRTWSNAFRQFWNETL
jgi:glycosyltransferase involved in cell wall biosynthesis